MLRHLETIHKALNLPKRADYDGTNRVPRNTFFHSYRL